MTSLLSRYIGFTKQLSESSKFTIRFLYSLTANDNRTVTCKNLQYISRCCGIRSGLTKTEVKKSNIYCLAPEEDKWRISLAKEVSAARENFDSYTVEGFTSEELDGILRYVCTT